MKKLISALLCCMLLFACASAAFAARDASLPYPDSAFFTYEDYTLHYRVQDAKNAKGQIMFFHGFAESTFVWENLTAILTQQGYRCVLVDLPDFGFSSRETKETNRLPREDVVYALMRALSEEPWYLAGHSMGGFVALAAAQKYPDSVKNLLLYSTCGDNGWFHLLDPLTNCPPVASAVGPIIEAFGRSRPVVRLLLKVATMDKTYDPTEDVAPIRTPFLETGTGAGIVYYLSRLTNTDYRAVETMAPILFVNGRYDVICPPLERIPIRRHLPNGSVDYIVKDGGHMLIMNRAEETAAVTLQFLNNNP